MLFFLSLNIAIIILGENMKRRKLNKVILFILIFCISIGFAYLSATLNINGSAFLRQNTWNVYFDNVEVQEESIELSDGDQEPTIDSDKTTVSYKVTFNNPGDEYIFNIDSVNDGTLNAQIELIETTDIPEELQNVVNFNITYLDGIEAKAGDVLLAGERTTYVITTGYNEDIELSDISTTEQELSLSITITYKQIKAGEFTTATFDTGPNLAKHMYELVSENGYITKIKHASSIPEGVSPELFSTSTSEKPIYVWSELGKLDEGIDIYMDDENDDPHVYYLYWYSEADVVYLNEDSHSMFQYYYNGDAEYLYTIYDFNGLSNVNTSKVINMSSMFSGHEFMDMKSLRNWNVSNVKNMSDIFNSVKMTNLNDLKYWKVKKLENISGMFGQCEQLSDIDILRNWDFSKVTDLSYLFYFCQNLTDISLLANIDTSQVKDISYMFLSCKKIVDFTPISNWDTSNVENMYYMFENCTGLTDLTPLTNWDLSKVDSISGMFRNCYNITDLSPISNWNVSNVSSMRSLFENCDGIEDLTPLSSWNTNKVTNMSSMFRWCDNITNLTPIANWNVNNLTNASEMFSWCENLTDATCLNSWSLNSECNYNNMFKYSGVGTNTPSWYTA